MIRLPEETCTGCEACVGICPCGSISMREDSEGFLRPVIDEEICVQCGLCIKRCPALSREDVDAHCQPVAFAAWHNDTDIRKASTSGGVFTAFAAPVLKKGGVVFGAAYDDDFNVYHEEIDDIENLSRLRGSKYVQSRIGDAYKKVKQYLEEGRQVLFSGAPCQIAGLKSYLDQDHEKLLTCDFICHGVPSPDLWQSYLAYLKSKYHSKISQIVFRSKYVNWLRPTFYVKFTNGRVLSKSVMDDPYYRAFILNVSLRPSCYTCKYKKLPYPADITMADFWAISKIHPVARSRDGVSILMANTIKGTQAIETASDSLQLIKTDLNVITNNSNMIKQTIRPVSRGTFYLDWDRNTFDLLLPRVEMRNRITRFMVWIRRVFLRFVS